MIIYNAIGVASQGYHPNCRLLPMYFRLLYPFQYFIHPYRFLFSRCTSFACLSPFTMPCNLIPYYLNRPLMHLSVRKDVVYIQTSDPACFNCFNSSIVPYRNLYLYILFHGKHNSFSTLKSSVDTNNVSSKSKDILIVFTPNFSRQPIICSSLSQPLFHFKRALHLFL